VADSELGIPEIRLADYCRRSKVAERAILGSALRDDFGPGSHVYALVFFEDDAPWSLFDLVKMEQELEALLRRPVDPLPRVAVEQSENYIRRRSILANTALIYAAR